MSAGYTPEDILADFQAAHHALNGYHAPDTYHVGGNTYVIDGVERDQRWVELEAERLRQDALINALNGGGGQNADGHMLRTIRQLRARR